MNKRIFTWIVMAAIVVVAGWNVSQNRSDNKLSDVALANVEALAQVEHPTITCVAYCLWDPNYNCTIYFYSALDGNYTHQCSGFRGS